MWFFNSGATEVAPAPVVFGDFTDGRQVPVRALRLLAISALTIILSASASVFALSTYPTAPKNLAAAPTATQITQANVTPVATPATVTAAAPKPAVSSRATTPSCSPGSDPAPTTIGLGDSDTGVISRVDSNNSYQVYGKSTSEIWSQINRCSPVRSGASGFAGDTSYQLNYVYRYGVGSDGLCRVASAAVSMHISQVFPAWSPATGTPSSTTSAWNSFIAGLHTHENGHVSIDNSYAKQIYNAMISAQSASDCGTLQSSVNSTVKSLQSQLDAANDSYDASTGHGRTQGATL